MDMIRLYDQADIEAGLNSIMTLMKEDKLLYVAVGKEMRENEPLLLWAIQNSGGSKIVILHVHMPDDFIPILGKKHHWSSLEDQRVKAYRAIERQLMLRTLDEYLSICRQFGVEAQKFYIETDSVEKGLLQLITQLNIEKLVMGTAAYDTYGMKMMDLKSKKAVYLQLHAPSFCHIWFICKGDLVHQRECNSQVREAENKTSGNAAVTLIPQTERDLEANCDDWSGTMCLSRSHGSDASTSSSSHISREATADPSQLFIDPYDDLIHQLLQSPPSTVQSTESLYTEEVRKRKLVEEEFKLVKYDKDRLQKELQVAMDQKLVLESRVANYDLVMKDLEEGMLFSGELLQACEKERDDLKIERDNVLQTAEDLLNHSDASQTETPKFFATFTFAEIKELTDDFNPFLQLWEGENGSIYKGVLSHSQVIVKMWLPDGLRGPPEYRQEVEILTKIRHPNIITLMGVCPEACALVYEYPSNGSLEDRLNCKDNTPPISWRIRISIAAQLCSALIFLHSRMPLSVVHGALKSSSILLDANFNCKISNLGFSHAISHNDNSSLTVLPYQSGNTDPHFFATGEVSPAMDIHSFGMVVLDLLTGTPVAYDILEELQDALDGNQLVSLLDASAGDWPYVQAEQLAQLALRCCENNPTDRPDLESEVWRILEPMRASCAASPSYGLGDEENRQAPAYFICPIFQEVMKDPHVAADGYTYEAEALRGWLDSGHSTSPMTNLQLEHTNLVPNHALRSAIQEWLQQH